MLEQDPHGRLIGEATLLLIKPEELCVQMYDERWPVTTKFLEDVCRVSDKRFRGRSLVPVARLLAIWNGD